MRLPMAGSRHSGCPPRSQRTGGHNSAPPSGPSSWPLGAFEAPQQLPTIRKRMEWWKDSIDGSRRPSWPWEKMQDHSGIGVCLSCCSPFEQLSNRMLVQHLLTLSSARAWRFLAPFCHQRHHHQTRICVNRSARPWQTSGWRSRGCSQLSLRHTESSGSRSPQTFELLHTSSFDEVASLAPCARHTQVHSELSNVSQHSSKSQFQAGESSRSPWLD